MAGHLLTIALTDERRGRWSPHRLPDVGALFRTCGVAAVSASSTARARLLASYAVPGPLGVSRHGDC